MYQYSLLMFDSYAWFKILIQIIFHSSVQLNAISVHRTGDFFVLLVNSPPPIHISIFACFPSNSAIFHKLVEGETLNKMETPAYQLRSLFLITRTYRAFFPIISSSDFVQLGICLLEQIFAFILLRSQLVEWAFNHP